MIQYKEIDENGFVIETYALEEGETPPSNYVESWGWNESFFTPKWDFQQKKWVENMSAAIRTDKFRESKNLELNQSCSEAILNGFDYLIDGASYHFSYDREAQANFQETYLLFQNDAVSEIRWTASIGERKVRLLFNKEAFSGLYFASVQHKLSCLSHYHDTLKPLLDATNSIENITAVKWESSFFETVALAEGNSTTDKINKLSEDNERIIMALLEVSQMVIN